MIDGLDMLVRSNGEPQQILARNRSILDVLESRGPARRSGSTAAPAFSRQAPRESGEPRTHTLNVSAKGVRKRLSSDQSVIANVIWSKTPEKGPVSADRND